MQLGYSNVIFVQNDESEKPQENRLIRSKRLVNNLEEPGMFWFFYDENFN